MYCGGTVNALKEWILSDAKQSPEYMTKLTCENIPSYLQKYFNKADRE